ncbi:MAG: tRNA (5-methylaminomethyl-2-thiouridylate)-methyltransferase [Fusobacteriota bacterium]
MRALALWSGGLDSSLAIKVIQQQGIEVIALNFDSYFFGGKNPNMEKWAEELGCKLEYIDFKEIHRKITENPPSGYGKNMNPCIDCHALMMEKAIELLEKYDAKFVITGEVLGQRPMSQNYQSLKQVAKLSKSADLIVRPLSGKLLPPTLPEEKGWIKREKLEDIQGRTRKRQFELAEKLGVTDYPDPGGGCLLTDPNYSTKLKILKDDERFDNGYIFEAIQLGRMYRFDQGKYIVIGRGEEENIKLSEYKDNADIFVKGDTTPGPTILGFGDFNEQNVEDIKTIFARYSKTKGQEPSYLLLNGKKEIKEPINTEDFQDRIKQYHVI